MVALTPVSASPARSRSRPTAGTVLVGYYNVRSLAVWNLDEFHDPPDRSSPAVDEAKKFMGKPSVLEMHDSPSTLAVSPDGRIVACGGGEGRVALVDLASLQPILTLEAHTGPVRHLQFSADGLTLLAVIRPSPNAPPLICAWTSAPSAEYWLGPAEFSGR